MIIYGKEKEILKAQKRSLAAWINNSLGSTVVDADNLIPKLSTGVILCKLAKCIQKKMEEAHCVYRKDDCQFQLKYWERAKRETFFARDNAEMFIRWCKSIGIRDAVLFESDGLVMQTQPRTVILCLLELSRIASKFGVLLPPPIQLPPTTISVDDVSDCSEDEFFYATTLPSTNLISSKSSNRWDSGCSSGGRSPSGSPVFSKTSSPNSSLKKKKDKTVVVVVRSNSDNFFVGNDGKRSAPRLSPKRNSSLVRSDTISSRMKSNATLSRSTSSIMSSKSSIHRASKGSTTSLNSLSQNKRSILDKRKKKDKTVVGVVRSNSGNFFVGNDGKRCARRVSPKRNSSLVRSDTLSSRMKSNAALSRSTSSIMSSKSSINRASKGSTTSLNSLSQNKRSILDKKVTEVARQYLKYDDKIQRLSEGHYLFGNKNAYLRIVRGNNVVVRIGGGWDTLEHFLSALHSDKRHGKKDVSSKRRAMKTL